MGCVKNSEYSSRIAAWIACFCSGSDAGIAASLPADLELDQTFQVHGYVRDLPAGAARHLRKSSSSKAVLRAELEAAMANYRGRGHTLPTGRPAGARSD